MHEKSFTEKTTLGRTGLKVSRIGLAGGYGVPAPAVKKAFHKYGVNYFYWEGRKPGMKEGLRKLAKNNRKELVIAIQSYDHLGIWLRHSVEKALQQLEIDQVDILFLGYFNKMPNSILLSLGEKLKREGKILHLGVSGHNRIFHGKTASDESSPFDVHMIRYNAAHRGAEEDVFARLSQNRPGITTYTATRWGKLLHPKNMPENERPLSAAECYRFVLSNPMVDVCLAGPRNEHEMIDGFNALTGGPLSAEEMERVRRIGDFVHG
jgi:aryl-alcohol dehydrogenase-like predicted oxidoreductase